jgi:hypothetical protein
MTEVTLDVFDKCGKLRTDFSDREIETLTPERRQRFFALVAASTEADAAEQAVRDAEANVRDCVVKLQEAQNAHNLAHPPIDRIDALRAVIDAQRAAARRY